MLLASFPTALLASFATSNSLLCSSLPCDASSRDSRSNPRRGGPLRHPGIPQKFPSEDRWAPDRSERKPTPPGAGWATPLVVLERSAVSTWRELRLLRFRGMSGPRFAIRLRRTGVLTYIQQYGESTVKKCRERWPGHNASAKPTERERVSSISPDRGPGIARSVRRKPSLLVCIRRHSLPQLPP